MTKKRVALKDIAQKVGVSTALVSYVLNGKEKEARVSEEATRKIKKAAKEMNYQPNLIARGLKFGKTHTIGLIVADISNPFFAMLAKIIEEEAQKNGYTVIFGSSDEQLSKFENLVNTFVNRQVDGIIITPVENCLPQIKDLQSRGIPFVLIDRGLRNMDTNLVITNNFESSFDAVSLLLRNGFKKIGMITTDTSLTSLEDRVNGYKAALKENKIKANPGWLVKIPYGNFHNELKKLLHKLLNDKKPLVDSLLFANNLISVEALKIIRKMNVKVPEHLGIIGFDESSAYEIFYSTITHIKQDLNAISRIAVHSLVNSMGKEGIKKPATVIVPSKIIERESSKR